MYKSDIDGWYGIKMPLMEEGGEGLSGGSGSSGGTDESILSGDDGGEVDDEEEEKTEEEDDSNDGGDEGLGGEEDKEDEDEEEDEDRESVAEDEVDEEEDGTSVRLSSWTDIKKKYPNFAKEFPDVKAALFRDERYGEIFGSPKEAEYADDKAKTFDQLSEDLIGAGDPVKLMDTIHKSKPESAKKIAVGILNWFQEKDKDAYYEVAALPIKQLCRAAYSCRSRQVYIDLVDQYTSALPPSY